MPDSTTLTKDARRKAKARIVLLGFEHPDLLTEAYKTASPVQAVLTRNVSYQLVMENGWDIEGIDMSTAFLQTLPTEEAKRLWTTRVKELRQAFGIGEGGVLCVLKNFILRFDHCSSQLVAECGPFNEVSRRNFHQS